MGHRVPIIGASGLPYRARLHLFPIRALGLHRFQGDAITNTSGVRAMWLGAAALWTSCSQRSGLLTYAKTQMYISTIPDALPLGAPTFVGGPIASSSGVGEQCDGEGRGAVGIVSPTGGGGWARENGGVDEWGEWMRGAPRAAALRVLLPPCRERTGNFYPFVGGDRLMEIAVGALPPRPAVPGRSVRRAHRLARQRLRVAEHGVYRGQHGGRALEGA